LYFKSQAFTAWLLFFVRAHPRRAKIFIFEWFLFFHAPHNAHDPD